MERKIIPFPPIDRPTVPDPIMERAMFFFDMDLNELQATIPQAKSSPPRSLF